MSFTYSYGNWKISDLFQPAAPSTLCPSSKLKISPVNVHLSCFKIKAGLLSKHFFVSGGWNFEVSNITMYRRSVTSRSRSRSTTTEMPSVLCKSTDMLSGGCLQHYDISLINNDVFMCDRYFMLQLVKTELSCSLSTLLGEQWITIFFSKSVFSF